MSENRTGTTRLISTKVTEETLRADLDRYKQKAIELGASQAEIIPAQWVEVDERVRLKCSVPRCFNYGRCVYCPPYAPEPEFMRKALSRFHWAVLVKKDVTPVEDLADIGRFFPHAVGHYREIADIVSEIETLAFADGYYLDLGFAAGSCQNHLCNGMMCQVLDSGLCRFPLRARPSMEGVGIDVYGLVTRVGWEICPIYESVDPKLVPCASLVGIIFVH